MIQRRNLDCLLLRGLPPLTHHRQLVCRAYRLQVQASLLNIPYLRLRCLAGLRTPMCCTRHPPPLSPLPSPMLLPLPSPLLLSLALIAIDIALATVAIVVSFVVHRSCRPHHHPLPHHRPLRTRRHRPLPRHHPLCCRRDRSCRPRHRPLPATLVTVASPPPLSPSLTLVAVSITVASSSPATHVTVAIAIAALTLFFTLIALVAVAHPPPSSPTPSPLPPSPSSSLPSSSAVRSCCLSSLSPATLVAVG